MKILKIGVIFFTILEDSLRDVKFEGHEGEIAHEEHHSQDRAY